MNHTTELIACAVRVLADTTDLINKPSNTEMFVDQMLGRESYDYRVACSIEETVTKVTSIAKKIRLNRKFKKITEDF